MSAIAIANEYVMTVSFSLFAISSVRILRWYVRCVTYIYIFNSLILLLGDECVTRSSDAAHTFLSVVVTVLSSSLFCCSLHVCATQCIYILFNTGFHLMLLAVYLFFHTARLVAIFRATVLWR